MRDRMLRKVERERAGKSREDERRKRRKAGDGEGECRGNPR